MASGKIMSKGGGIGESRIFADPESALRDHDWDHATVNGKPLNPDARGKIPWSATDQGIAEWVQAHPEAKNYETVAEFLAAKVGIRDEEDKKIAQYADRLQNTPDPTLDSSEVMDFINHTADPLAAPMKEHTPEGHVGLWMSKAKIAREGTMRGILQYRPVMKDGQPVEVGGMVLGSVPIAAKAKADAFYRARTADQQIKAIEKVTEQSDEIMSQAGMSNSARRRRTSDMLGGLQVDDPDVAEAEVMQHEEA